MQEFKMNVDNKMNEKQVRNLLQTLADIIAEEKGLKIHVEVKKKR